MPPPRPAPTDEALLVAALRRGDEHAFVTLVQRHGGAMLRVAETHVHSRAVAEEIVQETWLAVLAGVDRFERRSSVKTWIFRILTNRARTRAERERRCVPFSTLEAAGEDWASPADPGRVARAGTPGHWTAARADRRAVPADHLLARETRERIRSAVVRLPPRQQQVLVLRDVEGWTSEEVCGALALSDGNQRVLLHRARAKLRAALEPYARGVA